MIVVSNTSPLSNLLIVGQLELIQQIYQQVAIPPAVDREIRYLQNFGIDLSLYLTATWLQVQIPTDFQLVATLKNELDEGEAEVSRRAWFTSRFAVAGRGRDRGLRLLLN